MARVIYADALERSFRDVMEPDVPTYLNVITGMIKAMPTVDAIPVDWLERRLDETAEETAQGNDQTELNNAIFQVLVEWEKGRLKNGKVGH